MSKLLSVLRAQHRLARGDDAERARLEREIEYYVGQQAALHAEREQLRRNVMKLRKEKPR